MPYTPEEVEEMRRLMGITEEPEPIKPAIAPISGIGDITADSILFENIVLKDADGNVKENHPKLYVKKDVERNAGSFIQFTPYKGIAHFEQQNNGLFLPPFGLSCRIAVELFKEKQNPEIEKALKQYWDYVSGDGKGYGWHCQNTLLDWARNVIINYPNDSDFTSHGGNDNVNSGKRYELSFVRAGLQSMDLEAVLAGNNVGMKQFARQFTMLEQPEALVELGKYFNKTARLWIPDASCRDTRAAWLGCSSDSCVLVASDYLSGSGAARGVSRSER